jgi:Arc/MetJ-type ribon-helix-helix transcriptional regulator
MPKMQVYLPQDLYRQVKRRGEALNVSGILQAALREVLAEEARRKALDELVREYEAEHGAFTREELDAQCAADLAEAAARRKKRRRRRKAA